MVAVEQRRAPKRDRDRQVEAFGEALERRAAAIAPADAAQDRDRPFGDRQHSLQFGHMRWTRPDRRRRDPGGVAHIGALGQHIFGQGDHDRAGSPLHRNMIGALHDFRDARGILDLRCPFGRGAEKSGIVHLLERAAPEHAALDLADEENQRNRIMLRDMHAMGRIGRAGPAGHEADPRAIDQLGVRDRHHRGPRLLPADRDRQGGVMHRVERREIGFAGHAEDVLCALRDELVDEDLAAGPAVGGVRHRGLLVASCPSPALRGKGVG